jgi:hypothetical protein
VKNRTLFVINTEWTRLRRTGLSELSRIPPALNANLKASPWRRAFLILPEYASLKRKLSPAMLQQVVKAGDGSTIFVPHKARPTIKLGGTYPRIDGELPPARKYWEDFAENALCEITKISADGNVDILAIDWPTGPLVRMAHDSYRCCFTVDLEPYNAAARELWLEGVEHSDTIHAPTENWLQYLTSRFSAIARNRQKCKTIVFGTQIKPVAGLRKRNLNAKLKFSDFVACRSTIPPCS